MACGKHIRSIRINIGTLQVEDRIHILTDHLCYQLNFCKIIDSIGSDQMSVTENRHAVRNLIDLIQEVRNEDDPQTFRFQFPHDFKQQFHLIVIKG